MEKETIKTNQAEGECPNAPLSIDVLKEYRKHARNNEIEILQSKLCGCFFCRKIFNARDVQDWMDEGNSISALCPECGMDTIIGDASGIEISHSLMKEMNQAFYSEKEASFDAEAAWTYCTRYIEGKIIHKEKSEHLFISYLENLEKNANDPVASLALGDLYFKGSEFTGSDYFKAMEHYDMPNLKANPSALVNIGLIHLRSPLERNHEFLAYECFSKASALKDYRGIYLLADCYKNGTYVNKDPEFAFDLLDANFSLLFDAFAVGKATSLEIPEIAYRLGCCYLNGGGCKQDNVLALTYFLLASFALEIKEAALGNYDTRALSVELKAKINDLAIEMHLQKDQPVFDQNCLEDCIWSFSKGRESKKFRVVSFSKEEGSLDLELVFPTPTLVLDIGNLYCGFVKDSLLFHFNNVASISQLKEGKWNEIEGNGENGFRFINTEGNDGEDVFSIDFQSPNFGLKIEGEDK